MAGWLNKKVWIETFSKKNYTGKIIEETDTKLLLIDKFGFQVELSKIDIKILKEEF